MFFQRFYDQQLAQASYLIGCQATGDALVVDANRDIEPYVRVAAAEGLRISHVTETHIHADFVSGSRELAHRTGAALLLSDEGDADWKYAFAAAAGATLLHDGDTFMVGNLRFDVMHTPGHTPEHLAFLVTDTPAKAGPIGVLTGDFVFAGDVGRPDLLEKAANVVGTMESSARTLFASLQRFRQLPDHLQLWPGHGAGSACGKALGAIPMTTLGYERRANWALAMTDEQAFVHEVLAGQPEPPRYFAQMKHINRQGPPIRDAAVTPARLTPQAVRTMLASGAIVVDTRPAHAFASEFVPGVINIPLNRSFTTWAGWLLPYDRDLHLVVDGDADARTLDRAIRDLASIGLDRVAGFIASDVLHGSNVGHATLASIQQLAAGEVHERVAAGAVHLLDVRAASEWATSHVPGVRNIPLGLLAEQVDTLPRDLPIVLHCQGGARSAIACSVLHAHGVRDVINMRGGFAAWRAAGLPIERSTPAVAPAVVA